MKFYYTGSPKYNSIQWVPSLSLGGFVSSSELPNDFVNNIFSNVSELSKQNLRREAILIALKNTYNETIQNITFSFNVDDFDQLISEFSIAFVKAKINNCDEIYFDQINDPQALPYLTFEVISQTNYQFNIGNLVSGEVIGFWLVRKIIKEKVQPLSNDEVIYNYDNNIELNTEESFSIELDWSDDESYSDSL